MTEALLSGHTCNVRMYIYFFRPFCTRVHYLMNKDVVGGKPFGSR